MKKFIIFFLIFCTGFLVWKFHVYQFILIYIPNRPYYKVKRVIDGDTILLDNGQEIRYLGLDAPEITHENVNEECYGKEAKEYNINLLKNSKVRLIKDLVDKDEYGRLVRYVITDTNIFVNESLIKNGYAQLLDQSPIPSFNTIFYFLQLYAKQKRAGIWGNCYLTSTININTLTQKKCLKTKEVLSHIGEYQCIDFTVGSIEKSEKGNIWIHEKDISKNAFSATIFPIDEIKFNKVLDSLKNKSIEVRGYIKMYRNKPSVILHEEKDLKLGN